MGHRRTSLIDRRRMSLGTGLTGLATVWPGLAAAAARIFIQPFLASAFPYSGQIPDSGRPFLDKITPDGRRGHASPRGGIYLENLTYSSRDVLLAAPAALDPRRPLALVVFFHGNETRLSRDVADRQGVPRQLAASGLNAVLAAPQMAVDALDSSAGNFWSPGFFASFLSEVASRAATLFGPPELGPALRRASVIVAAYSGGYLPAAFALDRGGADERVAGLVLLDGLYGEESRLAGWLSRHPKAFLVSAFSPSTREPNLRLRRRLEEGGRLIRTDLPAAVAAGDTVFLATRPDIAHRDFLTRAWTDDPLADVLSRLAPFADRLSRRT